MLPDHVTLAFYLTLGHLPQFFTNIKQDFLDKNILDVVCNKTIQGASHPENETFITSLKQRIKKKERKR